MNVDPAAKIIRESRLDFIRAVATLHDRLVKGKGKDGLTNQVKAVMKLKNAKFAESDLVIARLQDGNIHGDIPARKAYDLIKAGKLTLDQFLKCAAIRKEPLAEFVGKALIDELADKIENPEPALYTEFKDHVDLDVDKLRSLFEQALQAAQAAAV